MGSPLSSSTRTSTSTYSTPAWNCGRACCAPTADVTTMNTATTTHVERIKMPVVCAILTRMAETVEFKSNGHNATGYLAKPPSGSGPGVLVIQEWWGLDDDLKRVTDQIA